jgi:hypothetical protein
MNMLDKSNEISSLLHGAVDMHVHSIPSHFPRLLDDIDLAESIIQSNMGGAVVKFHGGSTAGRVYLANKHVGREVLFGSITLNSFVGGINPLAVESEILLGAKIVWFPTIHAANHINYYGGSEWNHMKAERSLPSPKHSIVILDEYKRLLPDVIDTLDVAVKYDVCVATGHLSIEESTFLCKEAFRRGMKKVILTHVDFETQHVPLDLQIEFANKGVMIEKTTLSVKLGHISIEEMAQSIIRIGAEHCILATDFGQANNPPIPQGFSEFLSSLLDNGVKYEDLETMVKRNPAKMLMSN